MKIALLYFMRNLGGIHVAQHNAECCVLAGPGTGLVSAQHSQHYEQYSVVLYLLPGRPQPHFHGKYLVSLQPLLFADILFVLDK